MTRICLDTSAYSNFRRGEPQAVAYVDRAEWIGVPSVVLGELRAGFRLGARFESNVEELDEFLRHGVVEILHVDEGVAEIYAELFTELRTRGRPMPTNDIWIAATAASAGATVLTFDGHFRHIARIGTVVLAAPPGRQ